MMKPYRKLVVAVVGVGLMLLNRHVGIDLSGQEQTLVDLIIGGLTAAGVWGMKNDPSE